MLALSAAGRLPDFLATLPPDLLQALADDWLHQARADQLPPADAGSASQAVPWTTWAVIGGRGSGKTRTGAEWVDALARGDPAFTGAPVGRIALVGETHGDVRDVMVEGPSGVLSLPGRGRPRPAWSPSRRRLEWPNGAVALAFSAEEPDALRGPQFGAAWCDEAAKWRRPDVRSAFNMPRMGFNVPRSAE
jgi:phage terminase large subunit-like protein